MPWVEPPPLQHHHVRPHRKVLLECPIWGNAAYVIDADEQVWREKTKQQMTDRA